jgi:plastocyanin
MFARLAFVTGLVLTLAPAGLCQAAEVSITVRDKAGRPVKDAVVAIEMPGVAAPRPQGPYQVVQQDMKFDPGVLVVPVGADVSFPNRDTVRHHVYSFSPAKAFELRLYGREATPRTVKFDKPGAVALGCNIHDSMVSFIKVVTTPFAAKSDANGRVRISGLPNGAGAMKIWHPYQRAAANEISRPVVLGGQDQTLTIALDLRAAPDRDRAY